MRPVRWLPLVAAVAVLDPAATASAQVYLSYRCEDGTQVSAVTYPGDRRIFLQLDGHALTLPQRLAVSGTRYSGSGVSFWIRKTSTTLKRAGKTVACSLD
jgi:membrane-bound inhibitor of C-type lysozyme